MIILGKASMSLASLFIPEWNDIVVVKIRQKVVQKCHKDDEKGGW